MIHTNNPITKHKAGLLNLAQEHGNLSKACKVMGVSRDTLFSAMLRFRRLRTRNMTMKPAVKLKRHI